MKRTVVAGICLLTVAFLPTAGAEGAKPNVLFLICDDLNCDLGTYGHPLVESPNIDRLARRGVQFNHAYCQMAFCGPSRASFMTSLYPDQTLVKGNQQYVRTHIPQVVTFSQAFRNAGYFAARIGKIYHYDVPRDIGTGGYDDPHSWNQTINPRGRDMDDGHLIRNIFRIPGHQPLSGLAADGQDHEQTDGIAAAEAVELLERFTRQDRPFFLAVGLFRPHLPFVAPKKYFDLYPPDRNAVPAVPEGYLDTLPEGARSIRNRILKASDLTDDIARRIMQAYYACNSFADAQIGVVLDALESTGLADNTIVVFTSDHGYHMGEHGLWHKGTLFENSARVPLIIAGPGVKAKGVKTDSLAEMVDIYPTIAELCGVPTPDYLSGVSLAPVLTNPDAKPRSSALTHQGGYSVRTPRFRFTRWGSGRDSDNVELYDHQDDPEELRNLARDPKYADEVHRLSDVLDQRIADAKEPPKGLEQKR